MGFLAGLFSSMINLLNIFHENLGELTPAVFRDGKGKPATPAEMAFSPLCGIFGARILINAANSPLSDEPKAFGKLSALIENGDFQTRRNYRI